MKSFVQSPSIHERIGLLPELTLMRQFALRNRFMLRLLGWAAAITVLAFLFWQALIAAPLWPPIVNSSLLALACILGGLRLGADSAQAYIRDLHRLNRVLAEQNRELEEANRSLLRQLSAYLQTRPNIA